ncbi:hypothetical protein ACFTSF_25350 [Kribbella sp. NPDC056951]
MPDFVVDGLDDVVVQRLRARAASHGRSLEEEAMAILINAVGLSDESQG